MSKRLSSEERREEILNKSLKIIYEHGFYDLTIRNIAKEIGLSEAAVYRHFRNKEQIVSGLADRFFCHDHEIESVLAARGSLEKLKLIMERQMEIFAGEPLLTVITFQEEIFREYNKIWEKFNYHRQQRENQLQSIIEEGQKNGEIKRNLDPAALVVMFMGSIRMSVIRWRGNDFGYSIIEEGEKVATELINLIQEKDDEL